MPWPLPTSEPELLALAKSYPFAAPAQSYLFREGAAAPADPSLSAAESYHGRTAVIAHGSNRSPDQLLRKFGAGAEIPVTRAWLADYDVVFSAHVTMYGSIAANLRHAPGVRVCVFVTWLTAAQLTRMHETELGGENYFYGCLEGIDLALELGPRGGLREARVYLSTRGCVAERGRPLGLAAVEARGRTHAALPQGGAQETLRRRHRADEDLDEFILRNIRDRARRTALIAEMGAQALPAAVPNFRVIEV
jgi:hypothetical protein